MDDVQIVRELCDANRNSLEAIHICKARLPLPSYKTVVECVGKLRSILFPGHFGDSAASSERIELQVAEGLERLRPVIKEQIHRSICYACTKDKEKDPSVHLERANSVTEEFLSRLPAVRRVLSTDVRAAYEGDPAATGEEEAILCYPGVLAITCYRLAHELYGLGVALIPRMMTEYAHGITGIDIHPGATIGESFFIDHGTGVVIGETSVIGKKVRLYQGVTLGAKSFPLDENGKPVKGIPRHPIVEDGVIIYSEATILGRVTIGRGSVIGGNVWITHDVPPESRISQVEAK